MSWHAGGGERLEIVLKVCEGILGGSQGVLSALVFTSLALYFGCDMRLLARHLACRRDIEVPFR